MEPKAYKQWIQEVFDKSAKTYGQKYNRSFTYFAQRLVTLADLQANSRVLDVATGRGAIIQEVAKIIGPEGKIIGTDISANMIKETAAALHDYTNLELSCMDAESLDYPDNSFNYVFCGFGIFFFPHVDQALLEFFRVLKPGGKLLLSTWGESDQKIAGPFFEAYKAYGFKVKLLAHHFEQPTTINDALVKAGFKKSTITADTLDYVYPTISNWFNSQWEHGMRGLLEVLNHEQLAQLEATMVEQLTPLLQPDGLHQLLRVHYTTATKTKGTYHD